MSFITQILIAITYNSVSYLVISHFRKKKKRQRSDTENDGVITVEYFGAGAAADGAKGVCAGELKVSEVQGFEESMPATPEINL